MIVTHGLGLAITSAPTLTLAVRRRRGGALAGANLLNYELSAAYSQVNVQTTGGNATQQSKYKRDLTSFISDLKLARQRFQDARRATLLASGALMECWKNALYKGPGGTWLYAYAKSGNWEVVFAELKTAVNKGASNVTGLSDDNWAILCANADLGYDVLGTPLVVTTTGAQGITSTRTIYQKPPTATRSYAGGYSAAWNVLFYGANPQATAPNYATPSANNNTDILTNFGLMGFDQYLMGVEATKFLARLANDCPDVPETHYWYNRLAPLTESKVGQSQLEATGQAIQFSNTFFRAGENIGLLKASAEAGGQSAAEQEAARQAGAGSVTTVSNALFWVVLIGGGAAAAYFLLRKPKGGQS